MIDDPELRAEAARIRDRARSIRTDVKRHSKKPSWDVVREMVVSPLHELHRAVSEELLDPAYVPAQTVRGWAEAAGFALEGKTGSFFCYSMVFENLKVRVPEVAV